MTKVTELGAVPVLILAFAYAQVSSKTLRVLRRSFEARLLLRIRILKYSLLRILRKDAFQLTPAILNQ